MPTTGDFITSLVLKFFIDNGGLACDVKNHIVGALHTELYAYMCMFLIYECLWSDDVSGSTSLSWVLKNFFSLITMHSQQGNPQGP